MRILHLTKKYPRALGGDAIVVSNLEKYQVRVGHEVFVGPERRKVGSREARGPDKRGDKNTAF